MTVTMEEKKIPKISQICIEAITESDAKGSLLLLTKMSKTQLKVRSFVCGKLSVQPFGPYEDCV